MEIVDRSPRKNTRQFGGILLSILLLLLIATGLVIYLYKDEKRFVVVSMYGNDYAVNFSKNFNYLLTPARNKYRGAVLAETGDLLGMGNTILPFTANSNDSLQVDDAGDSLVFVNGKIYSIVVSGKANLLPWFSHMNADSIAELQTIVFTSAIPGSYVEPLKKIASLKPFVGLVFDDDDSLQSVTSYIKQADFFKPKFVSVTLREEQFNFMAHWPGLECLCLNLVDSVITQSIPAMPALKQCLLNAEGTTLDSNFLTQNKQLEQITFLSGINNVEVLAPIGHIKELVVNNSEENGRIILPEERLKSLSVLIISGKYDHIDQLVNCKKLRWLGLPMNTSQQQFNTLTAALPGLQVLQIGETDSITSFSSLKQMPHLAGLTVMSRVKDTQSLYDLKNLRYLSLYTDGKDDSLYLHSLEKALPGCVVVPNSGACLGSGWLLLLPPMVLLAGLVMYQVSRKTYSA